MVKFFNQEEEAQIIAAIRAAELATSGEIRVHVEVGARKPALEVATRIFQELEMENTQDRNAVLILLAVDRREFAILGDVGINKVVPEDFWATERDLMQQHFKRGEFATGIELVIQQIGEKLKTYFPYQTDDVNELPDEISYNKSK
ncbi:putative membrane protein [Lewinella aquimaris]|uniref:Putative membrane protein n=1 Tax=Neolewinella aquimaris TaxID=1835722 RepID=A0A840E5N7_9BACT|nr:TPM domain-containing protein [Neolewinella aquimaris]MBB4078945.1 putative membrane protein [Neolewinella aquimaris]